MEKKTINRTSKRKEKIHNEILNVAAKLISEKGSSSVSLEEISAQADVARKTLYNHFENKEALIKELIMPICTHARFYLEQLDQEATLSLDHIWTYCLEVWQNKSLEAKLLYQVTIEDFSDMEDIKNGFIIGFVKILKKVEGFESLKDVQLRKYADIIYEIYMPFLQSVSEQANYEECFKKGMTGIISSLQVDHLI